jgi:hypothetical protein
VAEAAAAAAARHWLIASQLSNISSKHKLAFAFGKQDTASSSYAVAF